MILGRIGLKSESAPETKKQSMMPKTDHTFRHHAL